MVRSFLLLVALAVFAPGTQAQEQMILHAFTGNGWSPASLGSDLILDLDASKGVTLDGGFVSLWEDQSPANNHATPITSTARPTVVSSGINGKPTVLFDGVDDVLELPVLWPTAKSQRHLFVVYRAETLGGGTVLWTGDRKAYQAFTIDVLPDSDPRLLLWQTERADIPSGYQQTLNTTMAEAALIEDPIYGDSRSHHLGRNGEAFFWMRAGQDVRASPAYIGARPNGSDFDSHMNVHIARVIAVSRALTEDEREAMLGYLNKQYRFSSGMETRPPVVAGLVADYDPRKGARDFYGSGQAAYKAVVNASSSGGLFVTEASGEAAAGVLSRAAFGGLPGIRVGTDIFYGDGAGYMILNSQIEDIEEELHLFAVYKPRAIASGNYTVVQFGSGSVLGGGVALTSRVLPLGDPTFQGLGADEVYGFAPISQGRARQPGVSLLAEAYYAQGEAGVSGQGVPFTTTATGLMQLANSTGALRVGNHEGGTRGTQCRCDVGRVLLYNRKLSPAEAAITQSYLTELYSVELD